MSEARTLPDLVGSSQDTDLKLAEEEYLRNKAANEELAARARRPGEVNLSQLLKKMYGDESVPPVTVPRQGPSQEKPNVKQTPFEAFPPPPVGHR